MSDLESAAIDREVSLTYTCRVCATSQMVTVKQNPAPPRVCHVSECVHCGERRTLRQGRHYAVRGLGVDNE